MPQSPRGHSYNRIVFRQGKHPGVAFLLTLLFGPLGLFYTTVAGAIFTLLVAAVVALLTPGFEFLVVWPVCIVWGIVGTIDHRRE